MLPDFSFSFAAISRRVPHSAPSLPPLCPSIVSCKWHVACGKLAGMSMELSPFGMLMWHVYERTLKNQRFLSLQNQINYRQNQLRSPPCRVQLAGGGSGRGERAVSSEAGLTALLRHEVDTQCLLEASYCCFMQQHEKCIHHTTCFHSDILQFCMW